MTNIQTKRIRLILSAILCFTLAGLIIARPVYADTTSGVSPLTTYNFNFFGKNGIYYYNPYGSLTGNNTCVTGSNSGYDGGQILTGEQLAAVQANQPFYEAAAQKYGFDWRIIAAIHIKEHNAIRSNPSNGQGAYQLYTYTNGGKNSNAFYPAGPISDEEFQRQTDIAAGIIKGKANGSLSTSDDVKRLFFNYNGANDRYKEKAIAMGFSHIEANNGEGSVYVMNKFDARRDPNSGSMDPHWPGMFKGDGVWDPNATSGVFGAYPIYLSLGGTASGGGTTCYTPGPDGGRLPAGESGMSLSEAQEFMERYKSAIRGRTAAELKFLYGMTDNDCYGGIGYNCVSFTKYFINVYTSSNRISGSIGNGKDVVSKLTMLYPFNFTFGGNTPRAYAIFSTGFNKEYGHTGVILGIDTNSNKAIIGEAACGYGEPGIKAYETSLSGIMSGSYTFAYPNQLNIGD